MIDILDYLHEGRENAVSKQYLMDMTGLTDRGLRLHVARLRKEHPILTNTKTGGYYLPSEEDFKGVEECNEFIAEQSSRINEIRKSMRGVNRWLYGDAHWEAESRDANGK